METNYIDELKKPWSELEKVWNEWSKSNPKPNNDPHALFLGCLKWHPNNPFQSQGYCGCCSIFGRGKERCSKECALCVRDVSFTSCCDGLWLAWAIQSTLHDRSHHADKVYDFIYEKLKEQYE